MRLAAMALVLLLGCGSSGKRPEDEAPVYGEQTVTRPQVDWGAEGEPVCVSWGDGGVLSVECGDGGGA